MTKPIVSVAAMMLVEEGKLDLLASVSKYLPEFQDLKVGVEQSDLSTGKRTLALQTPRRAMTVQDLLRHTSGLVYPDNADDLVHQEWQKAKVTDREETLAEMVTKMAKLPLAHQPGRVWEIVAVVPEAVETTERRAAEEAVRQFQKMEGSSPAAWHTTSTTSSPACLATSNCWKPGSALTKSAQTGAGGRTRGYARRPTHGTAACIRPQTAS
jgi:hypothetical protein